MPIASHSAAECSLSLTLKHTHNLHMTLVVTLSEWHVWVSWDTHPSHPAWHILRRCPACQCWCDLCGSNGTGKSVSRTLSLWDYVAHSLHTSVSLQIGERERIKREIKKERVKEENKKRKKEREKAHVSKLGWKREQVKQRIPLRYCSVSVCSHQERLKLYNRRQKCQATKLGRLVKNFST